MSSQFEANDRNRQTKLYVDTRRSMPSNGHKRNNNKASYMCGACFSTLIRELTIQFYTKIVAVASGIDGEFGVFPTIPILFTTLPCRWVWKSKNQQIIRMLMTHCFTLFQQLFVICLRVECVIFVPIYSFDSLSISISSNQHVAISYLMLLFIQSVSHIDVVELFCSTQLFTMCARCECILLFYYTFIVKLKGF